MANTDLFDLIGWREPVSFNIDPGQETSGLGSGQINRASLRPALWRAAFISKPQRFAQLAQAQAIIEDTIDILGTIYAWCPTRKYPATDLDGVILGASSVTIHTLDGDNRRLRIQGLPASYVLTRGDLLAFDFGSPTRRALHRVVTATVTADGAGLTPLFAVTPFIQPGAAVSDVVTLAKPAMEAIIASHSSAIATTTGEVSIELVQVV